MFEVHELLTATAGKLASGREGLRIKGISIDSRTIRPQEAFIAIKGGNFDGHDFIGRALKKGAEWIIREAGAVRYKSAQASFIEVRDTIKALGGIARSWRRKFDIPVIAVTGSNGKTITKEMISAVLSKRFKVLKNEGTKNNHIGLPITLLGLNSHHEIAVIELGTNHPGEIGYLAGIALPNIGVITNIGPAHLQYFGDLRGVLKEKYTLVRFLDKPRIALLNSDDGLLKNKLARVVKGRFVLGFGIKNISDFLASGIKVSNGQIEFLAQKKYRFTLRTLGYYNIYNALAAVSLGRIFGMEYREMAGALSNFTFPEKRLNLKELNNIKFIDDTYNANPASLRQALDALLQLRTKGRKIFVMGDMLELGSSSRFFHRQAGRQVARVCDAFITVGRLSRLAAEEAKKSGLRDTNIFICKNSRQARKTLFSKISPQKGDIVLVKGSRLMRMEEVF